MKNGILFSIILLIGTSILIIGPVFADDRNHRVASKTSIANVMEFGDPPVKVDKGSSALTRSGKGISTIINTDALGAEYAYTVWWVVFNKPRHCSDNECGEDDLCVEAGGTNAGDNSIFWATGRVSDPWGQASFKAHLDRNGELPGQVLCGEGITNKNAEIHMVVRNHGSAYDLTDAGLLEEALTTFNGGCNPGEINEGKCEDVQFAIHR